MFETLQRINRRPAPYEVLTTELLWNDPHVSKKMLEYHLDEQVDISSRSKAFIDRSVQWIVDRFGISHQSAVCDFGCGPGLYTTPLAEAGARMTGIDFSERSIDHARNTARQRNLQIEYVPGNYLDVVLESRFDLMMMIFCDFCALGPDQRRGLLQKCHGLLKPGGSLLLDVFSMRLLESVTEKSVYEYLPRQGFWAAEPHYVFQNTFTYEDEGIFLDKYAIFEETRTRVIYNWLQCYTPDTLLDEFQANGFRIVERYSNVAGDVYSPDSREIAVIAQPA